MNFIIDMMRKWTVREIFGISTSGLTCEQTHEMPNGKYMAEGPMYHPEDMATDHPERFIVSEIIRKTTCL